MTVIVGYRINTPAGITGEPGTVFDYVLAGNGVWAQGERRACDGTPLLDAAIRVVPADVRGLRPLEQRVELPQGPIPAALLRRAIRMMRLTPHIELAVAVRWEEGAYTLKLPEQEQGAAHVQYTPLPDTVLDLHSHPGMEAFFSHTDDRDDQGFRISGVVGRLADPTTKVLLRVGIFGHYARVRLADVFDNTE